MRRSGLCGRLFGTEETSIAVVGSPEHAARMLRERTPHGLFRLSFIDAVVGSVTVDRVVLRRSGTLINPYAPIFRGRFVVESGRTYLTGTFGVRRWAQTFMMVWFGLLAGSSALSLAVGPMAALERGASAWARLAAGAAFVLGAVALGLVGFVFVRLSGGLSRMDVDRIVEHVRSSLRESAV